MTLTQWFIFFLIVQIIHFAGMWRLYESAGRKRWEAAVPVYNAIVLMKIIGRPTWWTILLFIPVVNLIMFPVIWVETLKTFGKDSTTDAVLGVATLGLYVYYVNYTQPHNYITDRVSTLKTKASTTLSSLIFAVIVATLVHTYVMQPFQIPTSSLEKSLLVGDFLFVSKFHYGARTPMTAVAAPMVHDTLPIIRTKSYTNWPQLPYFRFPAMEKIENNDIVVFNWPVDTVFQFFVKSDKRAEKPTDKKSNYVKRCVGIPGDSLSVVDGYVHINGKKLILPERAKPQYSYTVTTDGSGFDQVYIEKELKIIDGVYATGVPNSFLFRALSEETAARIKNNPIVKTVTRNIANRPEPGIFPYNKNWNVDNLGPIYIPQKGKTVALTKESLPYYKKVIKEYEFNDLKVNGDEIRINGQIANSYTFKQDYYWMMGDNRHNSEDSRYWGFVPEDHVVGKPVFIWMSIEGMNHGIKNWSIRWERLFTTVGGDGQPVSYFKFFLILLGIYFAANYFIQKKKAAKE